MRLSGEKLKSHRLSRRCRVGRVDLRSETLVVVREG